MAREQRRLAAIVSADVAGYSRLMGNDESGTLAALKAHRRELIDPEITEYGGRIVKTTGDGLLLEFPSVVDAVRCAVDVQRGMAERNAGVPADQRIDFRIGINLGDIIIDGDDIFGDGVNVAARLQALAEAGGIYVSKVVRDQVLDKLSFAFEELGAQQVKNIARPIEVYRILDGAPVARAQPQRVDRSGGVFSSITRRSRWSWLAAGAAAVMIAGVGIWYRFVQPKISAADAGPPLMSVAIMPFAPASTSADDGHIAERITQDLTSASERSLRSGRVISHGLVAKYQHKAVDPRDVGRDLNVRYLVEGEVRNENGEAAVMARLVETTNGASVWSIRLGPAAAGRGSDDLAPQLSNGLRAALYDAEQKRVARLPVAGTNAVELVLEANRLLDQDPSPKGKLAARKLLEEALHLDPGCVPALLGLLWLTEVQSIENPGPDQQELVKQMDDLSKRALALDRDDPRVWSWRAEALVAQGQWDRALEATATALKIDPYNSRSLGDHGLLLIITGRPEEALPVLDRATALDPSSDSLGFFLQERCSANLNLGRYDAAIAACERSLGLDDVWLRYLFLLGAYAQKGDMVKAEAVKRELLKRQPDITIARLKAPQLWGNPAYQQQREAHLYAGLRKAGIPEN
jgi:class 3 adenylate cyclase/TolB-like protein/tetratricopeptide (TPR) repeat protein